MKNILAHLLTGQPLSPAQATEAFESIMSGQATHAQIGAMLALLQLRGITQEEMVAGARVLRAKAVAVQVPAGMTVIDTCGTGGSHSHTFNISTAAALVAAGAGRSRGVGVAKHGNRSVTSKSGSSQVLETLGVKLQVAGPTLTRCLAEAGICFCFAPAHHPAMKHAASVRQDLGFRTIFNLLAPMANPAGATRQVMGIYEERLTETVARVLQELGSEQAMVVHGQIGNGRGIGELTTTGPNRVSYLRGGQVETYTLDATALGLPQVEAAAISVDGPEASAAVIRGVLAGKGGAARDIVCLNAAAALLVSDLVPDIATGLRLAGETIDKGEAKHALEMLIRITQEDTTPKG